jgi:4-hydroxy-tetrahydrodipicolinate synthase
MFEQIKGVFSAAITPLNSDYSIDLDALPGLLEFMAERGCHGALVFGTTGEGTSFAPSERITAWQQALEVRKTHPDFRLLGGAGTPSLVETAELTKAAFDLGLDGVVCLPPYYFRNVSDDGLFAWFSQVIQRSVPSGGAFLGYHFPSISGVSLSLELLTRLKDAFPDRFAGLKDSSGNPEFTRQLGERFGRELVVLTGSDRLFSLALDNFASGCITALANLQSPDLRTLWEAFLRVDRGAMAMAQARLDAGRVVMERFPPASPFLKALLARRHGFPRWTVRPPLMPIPAEIELQAAQEYFSPG